VTLRAAEKSILWGNGEELTNKSVKEIQWETDEELAHAAGLTMEAERGKRHNSLLDNSGALKDEPRDGAPARRHHPKFNSWCSVGRDRL
jgi:hypothetical protein